MSMSTDVREQLEAIAVRCWKADEGDRVLHVTPKEFLMLWVWMDRSDEWDVLLMAEWRRSLPHVAPESFTIGAYGRLTVVVDWDRMRPSTLRSLPMSEVGY